MKFVVKCNHYDIIEILVKAWLVLGNILDQWHDLPCILSWLMNLADELFLHP